LDALSIKFVLGTIGSSVAAHGKRGGPDSRR
jgi:hypothetical protein